MHYTVEVNKSCEKKEIVFRGGPWTIFNYLMNITLTSVTIYMELEEIYPPLF
jgi:hypothetical protein